MRQSVESQIEQFNVQRAINGPKRGSRSGGMFEVDNEEGGGEEDPFFNAEEIAFKVRLQCHKNRKTIVTNMVKTG